MAPSYTRQVHKIDDQTLVQTLRAIKDLFPENKINCNVALIQGLNIPLQDIEDHAELVGRYAFQQASIGASLGGDKSFSVSFSRTPDSGPSTKFDEFKVSYGRDSSQWTEDTETVIAVNSILGELDIPLTDGSSIDDSDTLRQQIVGFGAVHKQMLASLNQAIVDAEERRVEAQKEIEDAEKKRAEELLNSLKELDQQREKLKLESYRSERRNMLDSLSNGATNDLRKTLSAPAATRANWGVFTVSLVLAVVAGFLAFTSISQLGVNSTAINEIVSVVESSETDTELGKFINSSMFATNWYLIVRSSLASLVALGALVYAANWLRSYYNSIQQANREIAQFNADLVRAGWVIETILEVQHEHGAEVPEAWVQGVTKGLFEKPNSENPADGPTEALKMLLGYGVSMSVGPDGTKLDLSEKGAKKLAKGAK